MFRNAPQTLTNRDSSFLQPDSSASASVSVHKTFVVFPLLFWTSSLDIHYTLKHFSWVPSHLRPSLFPFPLCCSMLPSSLPSSPVYHLAAGWLTPVFSLYLRSFISCRAYSTCGTSEMEVLCSLSVKHTHTNSQTYLIHRYTHTHTKIIGCAVEYGKSIWARLVGCCLYSFALLALVLMW